MANERPPRVRSVSREWSEAISRLSADVGPAFNAAAALRTRPPRLYHFTDCDGLVGIFESKKLRAALATALNDPSEIQYGIHRAVNLIDAGAFHAEHLPVNRVRALLVGREVEWNAYVVSFCETEDTALHWLHYGRSGTGVAIGCDSNALERDLFRLFPVVYTQDEQAGLFASVVTTLDGILGEYLSRMASQEERDLLLDIAVGIAADHFWMAVPLMKNPAYAAEREWRLIAFDPKGEGIPEASRGTGRTCFRTTAGRVVPYKECEIDVTPSFEIILGFSSSMKPDEPALKVLLEENLDRQINVRRSEIPVRS